MQDQDAKQILLNFIHAMCVWESDFESLCEADPLKYLDENIQDLKRTELIEIQEKYLSQCILMVHQERRQILNFRKPPEYQQTIISDDF